MNHTGRCACGAVTLEVSGKAITTRQCWCRQCQQIAAGGPTQNAIFQSDQVAFTGELASAEWRAASGNTLTFWFCPQCRTQAYAQSSARQHLKTVRFGFLDEPHGLRPEMAIWLSEAPDWAQVDPDIPHFLEQPPAPQLATPQG